MTELAERTGGHAAYLTNDLNRAIRRAIDDARVTYTIGYYSTDETLDGTFREIHVKVNRPHLDVRYRKGTLRVGRPTPPPRRESTRSEKLCGVRSTLPRLG
jgi:hypothetical protein